jgi:uncharacterized protein (TIGR02246 family)
MSDHARDPQDLERLLVARQHAGDVEGMVVLFEPDAVVDVGEGRFLRGEEEIRRYFEGLRAEGRRFEIGVQQVAVVSGDLALTSTRLPDGSVTAEVARRQPDGTWRWVIDRYSIAWQT